MPAIRAAALTETQVLDGLRWVNFFLAYQGRDDRGLQRRYAAVAAAGIDAVAPHWRAPIAAAQLARQTRARRIRLGVLPHRHLRPLFQELDHRSRSRAIRSLRLSPVAGHRRHRAGDRGAGRSLPHVCRQPVATFGGCACDPRRRARRAGLHRARHGRHHLRAGGAAAGAAAVRGVGPSGDDRACDDRRILELRRRWRAPRRSSTTPSRWCCCRASGRATSGRRCRRPAAASNSRCRRTATLLLCPQSLWKIHPDNDRLFARDPGGESARDAGLFRRLASGADRPLHAAAQGDARCVRHPDPRARRGCCRRSDTTTICASTCCATR